MSDVGFVPECPVVAVPLVEPEEIIAEAEAGGCKQIARFVFVQAPRIQVAVGLRKVEGKPLPHSRHDTSSRLVRSRQPIGDSPFECPRQHGSERDGPAVRRNGEIGCDFGISGQDYAVQLQRRNGIIELPPIVHQSPFATGVQRRQAREIHHAESVGKGRNLAYRRFQHPGEVLVGCIRKHGQHRRQGAGNPRRAETGAGTNVRRHERYPDTGARNRIATGRMRMTNDVASAVHGVAGDVDDLVGVHGSPDTAIERICRPDGKLIRILVPGAVDDQEIERIAVLTHQPVTIGKDR